VELQGAENHGKIHGKATFFGETLGNPVLMISLQSEY
jgi:hypothetical protein